MSGVHLVHEVDQHCLGCGVQAQAGARRGPLEGAESQDHSRKYRISKLACVHVATCVTSDCMYCISLNDRLPRINTGIEYTLGVTPVYH